MKMRRLLLSLITYCLIASCSNAPSTIKANEARHLFILSGQSNMVGLNVEDYFTPMVNAHLGTENTIVVKDAKGAQPIRRWDKNWQPSPNNIPKNFKASDNGDLYQRLISKVNLAIKNEKIASVTFLWMQGERDAREQHAHLYQQSFIRVVEQLKSDLNQENINVVIGRLSDFDLSNSKYKHWGKMREVQQALPMRFDAATWVNTDDLNDGVNPAGKSINNDLHYSVKGYQVFGQRLADSAIALIKSP